MSDKVLVRIAARQRVHYDQTVELTRAEWEEFKALQPKQAAEWVDGMLDKSNVSDGDPIEEDEFEAEAVDAKGRMLEPEDAYEG